MSVCGQIMIFELTENEVENYEVNQRVLINSPHKLMINSVEWSYNGELIVTTGMD